MSIKKIFVCLISAGLALGVGVVIKAAEEVPNGSFEESDVAWECDDNCVNPVTFYIVPGSAAKGSYYAYIFHEAGLYQDLTIPSGVSSLSFQYDNQDDGDETGSFTVSLTDTTSSEVYASETFSEQSDSWITGSLKIPSEALDQTVRLLLSNVTGFNRIDALEFATAADNENYATVKVRVFSAADKPVKNATVFIRKNGTRVSLYNLTTEETVTTVTTNKKGRAPKFTILRDLSSGTSVQLCVKKKGIRECAAITPENGAVTSYEFSFSNSQVK